MTFFELLSISVGLAMDAFAASICKGLCLNHMDWKKASIIASCFGLFQVIMPMIGFIVSTRIEAKVSQYGHYITFVLLVLIGMNMIKEAIEEKNDANDLVDMKTMLLLGVATSIDALAIGVTFAILKVSVIKASTLIGIVTFIMSMIGVKIGNVFGDRYEKKAQIVGGCILILIGIKILFT